MTTTQEFFVRKIEYDCLQLFLITWQCCSGNIPFRDGIRAARREEMQMAVAHQGYHLYMYSMMGHPVTILPAI
jgi:hypothetical protein